MLIAHVLIAGGVRGPAMTRDLLEFWLFWMLEILIIL